MEAPLITAAQKHRTKARLTQKLGNATIRTVLKSFKQGFLDIVYPPHCVICQRHLVTRNPALALCPGCEQLIKPNVPPFCLKCSRCLGYAVVHPFCLLCRRVKPHFDFAWGACLYTEQMRYLIHLFKYHQKIFLRHYFARLMEDFILTYQLDIRQFDLIVPIPLSPTRERERGFNQSSLLASLLGAKFELPIAPRVLLKTRHTPSQTQLSEKERFTNILGTFRMNPSESVKDKKILIVDDLLTTGATSSEAALVLKNACADRVGVFALAITA